MSDETIIYLAAISLAPLLIIGLTIGFSAASVARERKNGTARVPLHPASLGYSVGMKALSTLFFLIILGLCLLQSAWYLGVSAPTTETFKVTAKVYGVQALPSRTVKKTTGDTSAAGLPSLAIFALPMLSLCVRDWRARFGKPDQDELIIALLLGFAGGLSFYRRNWTSAKVKLGFFLACAAFVAVFHKAGPLIFYFITPVVMIWLRDIMEAAKGPFLKR